MAIYNVADNKEKRIPDLRDEARIKPKDMHMMRKLASSLELKQLREGGFFSGYGSIFGVRDRHGEIIDRGAFRASLKQHDLHGSKPALLMNHEASIPIGKYNRIIEDENGLYVEGALALETVPGITAYQLLKAGALTGLSVGYIPGKSRYDSTDKAKHLMEVDLLEISLVALPANPAAQVTSVKAVSTPREFERFLYDTGMFSRNQAKAICCHGFKDWTDEENDEEIRYIKQLLDINIKTLSDR